MGLFRIACAFIRTDFARTLRSTPSIGTTARCPPLLIHIHASKFSVRSSSRKRNPPTCPTPPPPPLAQEVRTTRPLSHPLGTRMRPPAVTTELLQHIGTSLQQVLPYQRIMSKSTRSWISKIPAISPKPTSLVCRCHLLLTTLAAGQIIRTLIAPITFSGNSDPAISLTHLSMLAINPR